ncbi:MAG: TonB-dependent receptor, partial [Sulfuriferula sp.]
QVKLHAGYSSGNDATNVGATLGVASQTTSIGYRGEEINAKNYDTPRGTVRDTGFKTTRHDIYWAQQIESGQIRLDVGQHNTRDAGTPALPMDMVKDDANKVSLSYLGNTALGAVEARIYVHDIDHLMDNYSLRPNTGMKMYAPATSKNVGVTLGSKVGNFKYGVEYLTNDFNAYSQVVGGARKDMFNNSSRDRLGLYGEWQGAIAADWRLLAGVRGDRVSMNTDDIVYGYSATSSASQLVQTNFNALDHQRTDYNVDATLLAKYRASAVQSYEFGLARKTRSPSILERYLWSSGQSSAGQADGYSYLGNIDLKPEVSNQITAATEWKTAAWQFKPTLYYNRVTDYIQGTSTGVIISGKPVLQYQNVNAELYGIDLASAYALNAMITVGGTLSYVRGKNLDNGDNLYRIAPLSARLYGEQQLGKWTNRVELNMAQRQNDVAVYNNELPTSGYAVMNLRTRWQADKSWRVSAGVENVFDALYYDHLVGINRVANSVIAVGGQLPGMGRSAYLSVDYTW